MSKWPIETLEGKIHIKHGFSFKSEFFTRSGEFIVLTPGNFHEEGGFKCQAGKEKYYIGEIPENYLHAKGDLIVAMTEQAAGLLGSCAIVPECGVYLHNQRLGLITTNPKKVLKTYIYHLFKTSTVREQIRLTSSGSKVKHTSPERIYAVRAPLPPIEDQQKIASFLSTLDAKIECNNLINTELETMAKTLYDYWFMQFDFPDENSKPYKSSGGRMVWNDQLKREMPYGWKVHKVGEMLDVSLGGTPSTLHTDYWKNGTINWLSSGEMNAFPVVKAETKITKEALDNSATKLMPIGTVAISITRYIRPTILAIDSCANQSVVGIHESSIFKSSYLYPHFVNEVSRYMTIRTGAMQPHINKETIKTTTIIEPENCILSEYYKTTLPIYQKIINNAQENLGLAQLRDWLLPMLINGQVTLVKKA